MANDPNSLANALYGNSLDTLQGYNPNTAINNPAGWAGFAFSPTLGWQQNADGSLSPQSSIASNNPAPTVNTNPIDPNTVAKPIPNNYNPKTGLFDSGTQNTNTTSAVPNGTLGGGTNTSPQLDDNLTKALKQLMQMSQDQSTAGQNLLKGLLDQLQGNINFNQSQTTRTSGQRDALVSALLGGNFDDNGAFTANGQGLLGGYNQLLGKVDQGLDPMTMAALNQQAIEGPQNDYQNQVQQLKEALGQRGAYGGGDTPGSFGDIVRGYAPLTTARDTTREGLLQQTAFQNTAQKNANNQLVANALSSLGGLTTNLATNYNPAAYNSATQDALKNALSGVGQNTETGFQGLETANKLASTLTDAQGTSLKGLLTASLVGSGTKALADGIKKNPDGSDGWLMTILKKIPLPGGGHTTGRQDIIDIEAARQQLAQHGIDSTGLNDDEIRAIINGIDLDQYPDLTKTANQGGL